jgi:hypothetical protein
MEPSYEPARNLGTRLGCEVVKVWETINPKPVRELDTVSKRVLLPRISYGSRERAEALVHSLEEELEGLKQSDSPKGRIYWAETRLGKAQDALESWTTGNPLKPLETELQTWRIGDLGLAMVPGEIFNQIGSKVKENSVFRNTFFVGYANDAIGYVPVPEAYPDEGYEVMYASQVDPEAAGIITAQCLQLLKGLHEK